MPEIRRLIEPKTRIMIEIDNMSDPAQLAWSSSSAVPFALLVAALSQILVQAAAQQGQVRETVV